MPIEVSEIFCDELLPQFNLKYPDIHINVIIYKDQFDFFNQNIDMAIQVGNEVNDSLVYKTDKGRIVYGGGGITPDYFVPLDTAQNTRYLNRLFNTNSIQEYTVKYAQENRARLADMGFDKFRASFKVTDEMLKDLVSVGEGNNLKFNEKLDIPTFQVENKDMGKRVTLVLGNSKIIKCFIQYSYQINIFLRFWNG